MKVKIIIETMENMPGTTRKSEIFNGELDIKPEGEYLTKISVIAEGYPHPICDVPFSPMTGHWRWYPPLTDNEQLEAIENIIKNESLD